MVVQLHNKYPLGVVILNKWHKHFHSIYDNKNNTPEQFLEYLRDYHNIQFETSSSLKGETAKYFPLKSENDRQSKYHGVIKNKTRKRFTANIRQFGKNIYIGTYDNDFEAAYFYNQFALKYRGGNTTINYLTEKQLEIIQENIRKGKYNQEKSSRFTHVRCKDGRWETQFTHNGITYYCGTYNNELLAAYIVNKRKIEVIGDDTPLNLLTKEEFLEASVLYDEYIVDEKYYKHKTNTKSPYSCVFQKNNGKWKPYYVKNGKNKYIDGTYESDKEAAVAYNEYVLKNNLDRKLNKII